MSSVSKMRDCLQLVCNNNTSPACMCSWDQAETMCPLRASLCGATAAAANTEVILVASHSLCKESSSSSSAWGERESVQHEGAGSTQQHDHKHWFNVLQNSVASKGTTTSTAKWKLLIYFCNTAPLCLLSARCYYSVFDASHHSFSKKPRTTCNKQYNISNCRLTNRWKTSYKTFNFMDFRVAMQSLIYSYSPCPQW